MSIARTWILSALMVGAAPGRAPAQDLMLSELFVDGIDDWIEVHNRGAAAADLSQWSLYLATATPGMPGNYWWAFPAGTTLAAGGHLRVHWRASRPAVPVPGELFTGTTVFDFLFGLGSERLPAARGALALLSSQQSSMMGSASVFGDWVGWGGAGLARESLAVQAGLWIANTTAPAPLPGQSLARHPSWIGQSGPPALAWFLDWTPTPLGPNAGAAAVQQLGAACAPIGHHLLGPPALVATSPPVLGNGGFALRVTNTTGLFLETCLFAFAGAPAPVPGPSLLPPVPGAQTCGVWIDPNAWIGCVVLAAGVQQTDLPLGLQQASPALAGVPLYAQALVFDLWSGAYPPYQGATNGLAITIDG